MQVCACRQSDVKQCLWVQTEPANSEDEHLAWAVLQGEMWEMTQIHLFSPPALFKAKMSAGFGGGGVLPWLFSCLFVQRASIKEFKWEKRYKEDIKLDKLVFNVHWKCVVSYKCDTILLDTCMTPQLVLVSAFLKTSIYMQEVTSFQSNCAHIDFPPWYSIENGSPSEASMFQCS